MELLGPLMLVVWGVAWISTLADILSWPKEAWMASGKSKPLWFVLVFFFQLFGLIGYWVIARPQLRSAA